MTGFIDILPYSIQYISIKHRRYYNFHYSLVLFVQLPYKFIMKHCIFGSCIPYHLPDDMPVLVMCTFLDLSIAYE